MIATMVITSTITITIAIAIVTTEDERPQRPQLCTAELWWCVGEDASIHIHIRIHDEDRGQSRPTKQTVGLSHSHNQQKKDTYEEDSPDIVARG